MLSSADAVDDEKCAAICVGGRVEGDFWEKKNAFVFFSPLLRGEKKN